MIEPFSFNVAVRLVGGFGIAPVNVIVSLIAKLPALSAAVTFTCKIVVALSIAFLSSLKPSEKSNEATLKSVGVTLLTTYPVGFDVHELVTRV